MKNPASFPRTRLRRSSVVRGLLGPTLLVGGLGVLGAAPVAPPPEAAQIESARQAMRLWVETRKEISAERANAVLSRDMLENRIELVEAEIERLRGEVTRIEGEMTDADIAREELLERKSSLDDAASALEGVIEQIETRTRGLLVKLPVPLRERVSLLSRRLGDDGSTPDGTLAERFMNTIGVLNEVDKFNGDILTLRESLVLGDGRDAEVDVVYIGLGQAFYVSDDGTDAGRGRITDEGWKWVSDPTMAGPVRDVVRILAGERPAAFVKIPVAID